MRKLKWNKYSFSRISNFKYAEENPFKQKELAAEKTYFSSEEGYILFIQPNF